MRQDSRCDCGASWPRPSQVCHCGSCHETFTGDKSFSAHRRGPGDPRRCATAEAMLALGLRRDARGRWAYPPGAKPQASPTEAHDIRLPRVFTLHSLFAYLERAYPAEPQPAKAIHRAITVLDERGWWFVWTGSAWALQC